MFNNFITSLCLIALWAIVISNTMQTTNLNKFMDIKYQWDFVLICVTFNLDSADELLKDGQHSILTIVGLTHIGLYGVGVKMFHTIGKNIFFCNIYNVCLTLCIHYHDYCCIFAYECIGNYRKKRPHILNRPQAKWCRPLYHKLSYRKPENQMFQSVHQWKFMNLLH